MNRITHFEIQAETPERAIAFYTKVFGWTCQKWEGGQYEYWMILSADKDSKEPGINGGLLPRPTKTPPKECGVNAFVCTIVVDDFDATATKILAEGGRVAMPKFALIGMAWQGYFLDTEGNTFGVHQADSSAK
jgi:predicted enzyme related to lactoylglutathione lyase